MKSKMLFFFVLALSAAMISCSDDEEEARKGDPDVTHEGTKWNIASVDYMLVDQNLSGGAAGQTYKTGTKENAGTFYFVEGSDKGSFEMNIEGYNKEDLFNYSSDDAGSVSIFDIQQSVGVSTNQNVIIINGTSSATEMVLDGSIVKQSTTSQFFLTIESITLVKQQ